MAWPCANGGAEPWAAVARVDATFSGSVVVVGWDGAQERVTAT